MLKAALRKIELEKRLTLSSSACMKLDDLLLIQFQRLNWNDVHCVGSFYPMESKNEPNTLLLAKYLKAIIPGLIMAYPIIDATENNMSFYAETETTVENKWGIQEPIPLIKFEPDQMDVILIPLLGFDLKGNRVGFGKGYYDKYLGNHQFLGHKIGISYTDPISKIEDTNQFDVPLSKCITPWKIYEF